MMITIPPPPQPNWTQTTTLDGATFVLTFAYNQRCACWYLSVADASGVDIYNGIKLACGLSLLKKCVDPRKPGWTSSNPSGGALYCVTSTNDDTPPELDDLAAGSGRCSLIYVTSDWVVAIKAGQIPSLLAQLQTNTQNQNASTYGQGGSAL